VCGDPAALSVIVKLADRLPAAAGVNVTVTVQAPWAAKLVPQLLELVNSVGFAPPMVIEVIPSAVFPPLVNVTGWPVLDDPTFWLPNVRVGVESWTFGPVGDAFSIATT
jgi:hypothetical protein